jgi:hypothetical protein
MYEDPIVTEVRQAGQRLAEQAEGDLHRFFQYLQEVQKQYGDRLVPGPHRAPQAAASAPPQGEANPA